MDTTKCWYIYPFQVLTNAPALHSLTIFERDDVEDILEFLNHIRDIRELNIDRCYLDDNGWPLTYYRGFVPGSG